MGKEKKRHGNNAKIKPGKKIEGLYTTNMAVTEGKIGPGEAERKDELVEYARNFVEENKK